MLSLNGSHREAGVALKSRIPIIIRHDLSANMAIPALKGILAGSADTNFSRVTVMQPELFNAASEQRKIEHTESVRDASNTLQADDLCLNQGPLDSMEIAFEDLFTLEEIQRIQDEFSDATGVASIITMPDGTPLTKPSNFCRLCKDIIRNTKKGLMNCLASDAIIGRYHPDGPIIRPCMSGGLWDAGAGIMVGGKHIASWMIGQVRNEQQTEDQIATYAREIDVDEAKMIEAFREVPSMSLEQFTKIAKLLFTVASQLSESAYRNFKKTRLINERKKVERKLAKSEEKYRALVETSSDFIWEVDQDGVYSYVSPNVKGMTGYEPYEFIGNKPYFFIPEPEAARVRPIFQKYFREKQAFQGLIVKGRRKDDGSERLFETNGVPVLNDAGELAGFIGTNRDVTENRKLQLQIEGNEAMLQSIFRAAPIAIGMVTGHHIRWANDYLFELTGYDRDELMGSDTTVLFLDQDELRRIRRDIYVQMEAEGLASVETRWITKKGNPVLYKAQVTIRD